MILISANPWRATWYVSTTYHRVLYEFVSVIGPHAPVDFVVHGPRFIRRAVWFLRLVYPLALPFIC